MGVEFIEYKGKKIINTDFSGLSPDEILENTKTAKALVAAQPPKSALILANFKNARFDARVVKAFKEYVKDNTPYVKRSALYNVSGVQAVIYRAVLIFTGRKNMLVFDEVEKAKDYLVKED